MPTTSSFPVPLPASWPKHAKAATLHVISLAHFALAQVRGWAANSLAERRDLAKFGGPVYCSKMSASGASYRAASWVEGLLLARCRNAAYRTFCFGCMSAKAKRRLFRLSTVEQLDGPVLASRCQSRTVGTQGQCSDKSNHANGARETPSLMSGSLHRRDPWLVHQRAGPPLFRNCQMTKNAMTRAAHRMRIFFALSVGRLPVGRPHFGQT